MADKPVRPHQITVIRDQESTTVETLADELVVGRDFRADVSISDPSVSRNHLKIFFKQGQILLEDLGSSNGTWIGGKSLKAGSPIACLPNEWIQVGKPNIKIAIRPAWALASEKRETKSELSIDDVSSLPARSAAPAPKAKAAPEVIEASAAEVDLARDRLVGFNREIEIARTELNQSLERASRGREDLARIEQDCREAEEKLERSREKSAREKALREEYREAQREAQARREALQAEAESLATENKRLASEIERLTAECERLRTDEGEARAKLVQAQGELEQAVARHEAQREKEHLEREDADVQARRHRAEQETYEAERKSERLKIEVELEAVQVRRAVLDKEMALTQMRKDEAEAALKAMAASIGQAQAQFKELEDRYRRQQGELTELKAAAEKARAELAEQTRLGETARLELQQVGAKIAEALAQSERDLSARRTAFEAQLGEQKKHHERKLEQEFAQRRLDEERSLERLRKDRRRDITSSVTRAVMQAAAKHVSAPETLQSLEESVRQAASQMIEYDRPLIDLPDSLKPSAQTGRKARQFWIKVGIASGVGFAAILFLLLFPQLPGHMASKAYRAVSSSGRNEDNVFLQEIKQKGEKFKPQTARAYRDSYTENVLYAEGYLTMKTSDLVQKKWTLSLNDFFIGTLGVGDRAIVDFVAAESTLIKELAAIADDIGVEFKDLGIRKMQEAEAKDRPALEKLVGGPENYAKFRHYEKAFYEEYLSKNVLPAGP